MSDRFPASISIPKKYIEGNEEVKKILQHEFDYGEGNAKGVFGNYEEHDGICTFFEEEASYGAFWFEELLEKKKIPYDRWFAAYSDDSGVLCYRPDMDTPWNYTNGEGNQMIEVSKIRKILNNPNLKEDLEKILPPEIPPLENYK